MRLMLALAVLAIAGCGSSEPSTTKIEHSLRNTAQARIDKAPDMYGRGTKVTKVSCVEGTQDRTFKCSGGLSNGEHYSTTVTVSKDGKRFVSNGD